MQVRRDERVQTGGLLGGEPETTAVVARRPDTEPIQCRDDSRAGVRLERLVVENGLAFTPAGVRAHEGAVVAVPRRPAYRDQALESRGRRRAPAPGTQR